jgi:glycerophosphoryl diester phosphodiesterase
MISLIFLFSFYIHAQEFDWQAHRGARGLMPENTMEAIEEGLKYPISTIEIDVVISQDGQVVVSHEPWMEEEICLTPEGKGIKGRGFNLFQMKYEQIMSFDCGSKIHPRFSFQKKLKTKKPLLKEILISFKDKGKNWSIEIKSTIEEEKNKYQPNYKKFTDLVLEIIKKELSDESYYIQSFDWRVLKYIHKKYPKVKLVALRETPYTFKNVIKDLGFYPQVFSPDYKLLTLKDVREFQVKKIKVIPWTVNEIEEMKTLINMGVDGIITDYPDRILKTLESTK